MNSLRTRILTSTLISLCAVATIFIIVIFIAMYGPALESKYFPVVSKFTTTGYVTNQDMVHMAGTFTKYRANCNLESISAYITSEDGTTRENITIRSLNIGVISPTGFSARSSGMQKWGTWAAPKHAMIDGKILQVTSYHKCHPLYLIPTVIINEKIPLLDPEVPISK